MRAALVALALMLAGCGMWLSPQDLDAAQKECAPHGGIKKVRAGLFGVGIFVLCNNGTTVGRDEFNP